MVGGGNVLKNLFRTFLGYNWYINDPFSEWQSGEKKTGSPGLPYLFILVKRRKICAQENENLIGIFFNVLVTKHVFNGYMCSF